MRSYFSLKAQIANSLAVISLTVLLTGCGGSGNTPTVPSPVTPTSTPTTIPSPVTPTSTPTTVPSLNTSGQQTINIAGLSINSADGIQCPLSDSFSPSDYLVLATDRTSYDSGELQDMETYVSKAVYNNQSYLMPPPAALEWVPGGYCDINLLITNIGNTAIEILSAGVKLQQDSQPNNFQYRLVDACSLLHTIRCQLSPILIPHCRAKVPLTSGSAGTVFENTFTMSISGPGSGQDQQCPVITLQPNKDVEVSIDLFSSSTTGIYSVVPQLKLGTSNGPSPLSLDQLTTSIAISNSSQFSCYSLQGDTFVQVDQKAHGVWCV